MVDLSLSESDVRRLQLIRMLGKEQLRPLGLECDRKGEALPPDHPFFQQLMDMGVVRAFDRDKRAARAGPKTAARKALLFAEEASYWDRGMTVAFPGPGLSAATITKMGTEEQRARFLSIFTNDKPRWGAFGMTEPSAGSDVAGIRTTCRKDGDHWVLNGAKTFISNVKRAEWCVIFATVDRKLGRRGHRVFVVERDTPGFEVTKVEDKMGLKAYESCSLVLDDCRVPARNLLGGEAHYDEQQGFKGAMTAFNSTRSLVAVMAVGVGRAAWDHARSFMRDNYDLSRPIPRYRRMQERMAEMKRKLDTARLLCWRGGERLDHGEPNALEASMAKSFAPPVALEACSVAIEVLADAGVRNDQLVEKLYRDVKAMDIVEGTQQIQRTVIARRLVGLPSLRETPPILKEP